jgi:hypothetical protein
MAGPGRRIDAAAMARIREVAPSATTTARPRRIGRDDGLFKAVAGYGLIAVIVLVAVTNLVPPLSKSAGGGAAASPSFPPAEDGDPETDLLSGRHSLTVDGVPLSFGLPADSRTAYRWESLKDDLYISRNTGAGGQNAEAIILWTSFPDSRHARPCLVGPSAGSSVADLAAAMAAAPGTDLVRGPSDVIVGGLDAKHVVLTVLPLGSSSGWYDGEDRTVGCDPAYFFGWDPHDAGAFWFRTEPGDTIQVWLVEAGGTMLVIESEIKPVAGSAVEQEIQEIIRSIRFE